MGISPIRIAILDLYDGVPNMGMRCIHAILNEWAITKKHNTSITVFKTDLCIEKLIFMIIRNTPDARRLHLVYQI